MNTQEKLDRLEEQVNTKDAVIVDLITERRELQAKLEASERKRIGVEAQCDELLDDCDRLIAEIKELQAQVVKYGDHTHSCASRERDQWGELIYKDCNCGWDAIKGE